ncbi:Fe2+-dependent dioxygenase [Rhodoferax sp. BAB1]|uniref:Fe2+-dependent dioxygenase n=1 Tax=Rhodoferax sp. BAB1 TaxID=2741720 RepID=UPI001575DB58|nr:Fe2+-dependent dioxygenase [Rhodoferax sp. BAB1]QKO22049.1 Fe2+-dependent dioxygenase [Rhodoferax sp. BAB1]
MLLHIPDILNTQELRRARELLAGAAWDDGKQSAGVQAAQVKNNEQLPHDCEAAREIRTLVLRGLDRSPAFFSAALPKKVFTPRINRYGGSSNHYGRHIDNAIRALPDSGQRVRTDISCTVFLAEPDEYEGGELCISDTFGDQAVKLPAGHMVLYPGTSLHEVRPVTRGQRLACFFWIESMVRSDEQRRLLYELDMNLLRLRQQHGENAETTALTGTYHNLLRMWSDT